MAESKKDSKDLTGKHVEVFLKNPLFRFKYSHSGKERELLENAVRVSGTVLQENIGGITIRVQVISNMKTKETDLPFDEIFLPYDKIDFAVVE